MIRSTAALFVVLAMLVGCRTNTDPPLPPLHPVKGQVVNKGVPVKGGMIAFRPADNPAPLVINAEVKEDGRFELTTFQDLKRIPGAPEGKYVVIYSPPDQGFGKRGGPTTFSKPREVISGGAEIVLDLNAID